VIHKDYADRWTDERNEWLLNDNSAAIAGFFYGALSVFVAFVALAQ